MNAPIRLFDFPGGLHLDDRKTLATGAAIRSLPIPPQLVLPLAQHIGSPARPLVEVGQTVQRGQLLAEPVGAVSAAVHASSSGRVVAIGPRPVPHPSGLAAECIVIQTDGLDTPAPPAWTATEDFTALSGAQIRDIARQAGIVGLGGAAFPAAIKLNPGRPLHTLIINGAECEPYISCDQMLMTEQADEIIAGIRVILHAVQAPRCLIGVEDNKPEAIRALSRAALQDPRIHVVVVPTRYPQGGERQLIQTLTGEQVPSEGLPLDIGILCHNPATARAIWRAVRHAEPLTERIVTVTGEAIASPQNLRVRIGTPIQFLLDQAGGYAEPPARLLMGGPMMGFQLRDTQAPVIKASNCILALPAAQARPAEPAQPCIRCGDCASVCPASLLPQQLYWHARAREFDKAQALSLFDCIECGCCALVCPSHIPLVQFYRYAKTEIWAADAEQREADAARQRFEARKLRLQQEDQAREEARARKKAQLAARAQAQQAGGAVPQPAGVPPAPRSAAGPDEPGGAS